MDTIPSILYLYPQMFHCPSRTSRCPLCFVFIPIDVPLAQQNQEYKYYDPLYFVFIPTDVPLLSRTSHKCPLVQVELGRQIWIRSKQNQEDKYGYFVFIPTDVPLSKQTYPQVSPYLSRTRKTNMDTIQVELGRQIWIRSDRYPLVQVELERQIQIRSEQSLQFPCRTLHRDTFCMRGLISCKTRYMVGLVKLNLGLLGMPYPNTDNVIQTSCKFHTNFRTMLELIENLDKIIELNTKHSSYFKFKLNSICAKCQIKLESWSWSQ